MIQIIDIRMSGVITCLKDRNIDMIGDIIIQRKNENSIRLGVSGVGGFSIWELESGFNVIKNIETLGEEQSSTTSIPMILGSNFDPIRGKCTTIANKL